MKKLAALLLTLALVFSLTACSDKKDENTSEGENTTTEENADKENADKEGDKEGEEKPAGDVSVRDLMNNKNARLAFAHGFDKEYIADTILGNGSKAVDFLVPTGLAIGPDDKDFRAKNPDGYLHYDADLAKDYWAKAKEELGFDTIEVEFLTFDSEGAKKISEYIQAQLQDNLEGLTLKINQQPFKQKIQLADKGQFQFEFAGWGPDYPDPMTFLDMWVTGGGHNTAGYNNADYDKMIEDTKVGELATKEVERWTTLQDAEKTLLEDGVIIPLYQRGSSVLERPYVKGIMRHQFGADYTYKNATTEKETDGKKIIRLAASGDIPNLDTNKSTDQVSFQILGNVLEGLTMLGEGDVVVPGLAEKWDISEDKKTYTFHLRDAKWSNGDPVVAQDFVDSWQRLANKDTGSQYQFMIETAQLKNYAGVMDGSKPLEELGVKATDEKTLVVELEQPVPFFLKLMSFANFYPINKKFVDEKGEDFGTSIDNLLFCGAYVVDSIENGYGYSIAKNPNYYDVENVKNDGVTFRIVKDVAAGVNLYETKETDRCGLNSEYVEQYQDRPDFKEYPGSSVFYLVLNVGNDGE